MIAPVSKPVNGICLNLLTDTLQFEQSHSQDEEESAEKEVSRAESSHDNGSALVVPLTDSKTKSDHQRAN